MKKIARHFRKNPSETVVIPEGKSDDAREVPWAIFFQTIPEDFHFFSSYFLIKTVKIMRPRLTLGLTLNILRFYSREV